MFDDDPAWRKHSGRPVLRSNNLTFWHIVAAVVVGILIADAITWTVVELRARAELAALNEYMEAEAKKLDAQLQAQRRADAERQQRRRDAERDRQKRIALADQRKRQVEYEARLKADAAAKRDRDEGRYLPPATAAIKVDAFACKDGQIVRRTADGWLFSLDGHGNPVKCRTAP